MNLETLWTIADRARKKPRLASEDLVFVRKTTPKALEAGAIRYFECRPLAVDVRRLITHGGWRFDSPPHANMVQWSLG